MVGPAGSRERIEINECGVKGVWCQRSVVETSVVIGECGKERGCIEMWVPSKDSGDREERVEEPETNKPDQKEKRHSQRDRRKEKSSQESRIDL